MDDFYIDEKGLAAYFEMQWLDFLRENGVNQPLISKSKTVPDSFITSEYTRNVSNFITRTLRDENISPTKVLEVGPALGRNCYELVKSFPTIESISVVEPSRRLLSNFRRILIDGDECEFPYIKSIDEIGCFSFDAAAIASSCSHVDFTLLEEPFGRDLVLDSFGLVTCLNVLDQCESPKSLVDALKTVTAKDGVLFLSCSYQWSKKHLKKGCESVDDINEYFGEGWVKLSEDEHEYRIRFNERYSMLFLSHIVGYKRINGARNV